MKTIKFVGACLLVALLVLSACKPNAIDATPTDVLDDIRTVAARTIEAMTTQLLQTSQAQETLSPQPPILTEELPDPTQAEAVPSIEVPTAEIIETPTPSEVTPDPNKACDLAAFVSETVPDGSQLYPGTMFNKTWTLRNEGTCTWTKDYAVVFISGDSMLAPAVMQLTDTEVKPGESLELSMPLIAPSLSGSYRADFKLRNAAGVLFAFKNPDHTFWADIQVQDGVIHLVHAYCSAAWSSDAGKLHCPGLPSDAAGYVYSDNAPKLENGAVDDEPTLWLGVQAVQQGYIKGVYPAMKIPNNARFSSILGCGNGLQKCAVKFILAYQEGDGQLRQLGSWDEVYDGEFTKLSLDLSELGGRTVSIVLIARAIDSWEDGKIHLLEPVIKP